MVGISFFWQLDMRSPYELKHGDIFLFRYRRFQLVGSNFPKLADGVLSASDYPPVSGSTPGGMQKAGAAMHFCMHGCHA